MTASKQLTQSLPGSQKTANRSEPGSNLKMAHMLYVYCSFYLHFYKNPSICDTFNSPVKTNVEESIIFDKTNIALYTGKFFKTLYTVTTHKSLRDQTQG